MRDFRRAWGMFWNLLDSAKSPTPRIKPRRRSLRFEGLERRAMLDGQPTATDDFYNVLHDEILNIPAPGVLENDDGSGGPIVASLVSGPGHGSVTLNSDGSFEYSPDPGYSGSDVFVYRITNGSGWDDGEVSIGVYNAEPAWDESTIAFWEIEEYSGYESDMSGLEVGQLHAGQVGDNDPLTYSLASSSSYFTVQANGLVRIADAAGLVEYFDTHDAITVAVQVTDGFATVLSEFVLNKHLGFIDQTDIYVETVAGATYRPATAEELIANLETIRTAGGTVKRLIIKGHGSEDGMQVGNNGEFLTAPESGNIFIGSTDVTGLLNDITDANSVIALRGCYSRPLARRIDARLDGAEVWGSLYFALGIPGTTWGIGIYSRSDYPE